MKKVFIVIIFSFLFSCTSESDAKRALEAESFTDIEITGWNYLSCGKEDFYRTGFCATNTAKKRVCGTVCSGLIFKGSTIRY